MGAVTKLNSSTSDHKNYFSKEMSLLKLFGLSIAGSDSVPYKIYSILFISFFNGLYPFIIFWEITQFIHDFEIVADMITYFLATFVASNNNIRHFIKKNRKVATTSTKIQRNMRLEIHYKRHYMNYESLGKTLVLLRNRKMIHKMLTKLQQKPFTADFERGGDNEKELIKKCLWITSAQSLLYWTCTLITLVCTMSYVIFKRVSSNDYRDWELPYGPMTILNITRSPDFEITLFYQNFAMFSVGCHFSTVDLIAAGILAHISFQFKILQNNLRLIISNSFKDMYKDRAYNARISSDKFNETVDLDIDGSLVPWKYLHASLKKTVDYHLEILNLAKDLEYVFSELLLLIFLGMLSLLCFGVYHASTMKDPAPAQLVRYAGEMFSSCIELATICYWGEQVMFESQQVGNVAAEVNFVGTDLRFQKGLALIMRRSQNPTGLTAGKFADVTLATFFWVLRTSYSSLMVLRKNNNQQ